jgi:hypothetical protein
MKKMAQSLHVASTKRKKIAAQPAVSRMLSEETGDKLRALQSEDPLANTTSPLFCKIFMKHRAPFNSGNRPCV